jgi:nitrite reductase/ring-hydroxylating ferredoxin subunit
METTTKSSWFRVAPVTDVPADEVCGFQIAGRPLAVYFLEGRYYANLVDGYLCDGIIECPKHNARFEVATGKCLRRPAKADLKTYPVKVENGEIYIQIEGE